MEFCYKNDDDLNTTKDIIFNNSELEVIRNNKIKEFNFYYNNLKGLSNKKVQDIPDSAIYNENFYHFLRKLRIFINEDDTKSFIPHSLIEKEMIRYLCQCLNSARYTIEIYKEIIDLLTEIIIFLNFKHPIDVFQGQNEYVIETYKKMSSLDFDDLNKLIIEFFNSIYDEREDTINFIFSIRPFNKDEKLLFHDSAKYGRQIAKFLNKLTRNFIPPSFISKIIESIKIIFCQGGKDSFRDCFLVLINIASKYQTYKNEEDKEMIKNIFENENKDDGLPYYCEQYIATDDAEIQYSIFRLVGIMCFYEFNITNFASVFKLASKALDIYDKEIFVRDPKIRYYASILFKYAFSKNFANLKSLLDANSIDYVKKLSKLIEDDTFSVVLSASEALLCILNVSRIDQIKKIIFEFNFFDILLRIIEIDNFPVEFLIKSLKRLFQTAEKQDWYSDCLQEFINSGCYESMNEMVNNVENQNDIALIGMFLKAFDEQRKAFVK